MVTKIYLVRHCQTMGNLNRIFQGGIDTDPSPDGLIQLDLLALRFRNIHIDKIYSSTLGRAVKTAQAINKYHNVEIEQLEGFKEISVGDMDGADWDKVPELFPENARQWNNEPWNFTSPNGETMRDVYARMSEAFEKVISESEGKTVVITSHGCALRNLLCYCMGKDIEELNTVEFGANTAVSLVEINELERKLVFSNDSTHLPEEAIKMRKGAYFKLKE